MVTQAGNQDSNHSSNWKDVSVIGAPVPESATANAEAEWIMVMIIASDCTVMRFIAVGTFSFRLGNRENLPFDKEYRLLLFLVPINTYTGG